MQRIYPRDKTVKDARLSANDISSRIPLRMSPFSQDSGSLPRSDPHCSARMRRLDAGAAGFITAMQLAQTRLLLFLSAARKWIQHL